jgi:hypothetical protein
MGRLDPNIDKARTFELLRKKGVVKAELTSKDALNLFVLNGTLTAFLDRYGVQYEDEPDPVDEARRFDRAEAYDLDDPKHPTYHERMADAYDMREGK